MTDILTNRIISEVESYRGKEISVVFPDPLYVGLSLFPNKNLKVLHLGEGHPLPDTVKSGDMGNQRKRGRVLIANSDIGAARLNWLPLIRAVEELPKKEARRREIQAEIARLNNELEAL